MDLSRSTAVAPAALIWTFVMTLCLSCASHTAQLRNVQPGNDAPTYRRVIDLGTKAAQAMDAPSAGFRYGVIDMDGMNAMVDTKNKNIYVTKGLMSQLNDKELLCVFAHEWAHVTKGHYGKQLQTSDVIDGLSALVAFSNPLGIIASAFINPIAKKSFSRAQEEEADAAAAKVLNDRLRISPYACISAFRKLKSYGKRTGGGEGGGWLDSHPSTEARIAKLKELWPDPPKVYTVSQIIVGSAEEARAVAIRLNAGESFSYLASTFSTDALAKVNKGEIGLCEEWELNSDVLKALKNRQGGELILFRSPAGFNIVKAKEVVNPRIQPAEPAPAESPTNGQ